MDPVAFTYYVRNSIIMKVVTQLFSPTKSQKRFLFSVKFNPLPTFLFCPRPSKTRWFWIFLPCNLHLHRNRLRKMSLIKNKMEHDAKNNAAPLLESISSRRASKLQTLGNIIVTVVGTGILGLPFAFRIAGWVAGSLGVAIVGISTYYCMLLLVMCHDKLASEEPLVEARTYGDLGYRSFGTWGRYLTELIILVAQCAGSVAYLVFIGQNLDSIFQIHGVSFPSYVFMLVPVEIGMSWIGSLSALAPFSIFADGCNALAMGIVMKEDVQLALRDGISFGQRTAVTSNIRGLPFAAGMAVFCFEGFGMTLALENSMQDKTKFPKLLAQTFSGITIVYILFGLCGYMAFGEETRDIVTLNLPRNWSSLGIQVGLCLGLMFTFPIMLHPVNEIVEAKLKIIHRNNNDSTVLGSIKIYISRAIVVVVLAVIASFIPAFGVLASFVGSTLCAMLSFVLPATFHLKLFGSSLRTWQKALDYVVLTCGLFFAGMELTMQLLEFDSSRHVYHTVEAFIPTQIVILRIMDKHEISIFRN